MTNFGDSNIEHAKGDSSSRVVHFEHTLNFAPILDHLGVSVLVSTYQAGKLVVIGSHQGRLLLSFYNFERAMGVASTSEMIAVGTHSHVWFLCNAPELAAQIEPHGQYDACFLSRWAQVTNEILIHEMAWAGNELWIVNTQFSCLCTLQDKYHFVPRWQPPFISSLAAEDRCHLNGLAIAEGRPHFVTVLAESDTAQGWRPHKASGGCILDVASGAIVARGFAMPHSPRVHQGRLLVLDSGCGQIVLVDRVAGAATPIAQLNGYLRGLALHESWAFVGLSRIRETSTFGGLPIAEKREQLQCGVAIVDLNTGQRVAFLEFQSGVEEIFDVQLLHGIRAPILSGPYPHMDDRPSIWTVPIPRAI